MRAAAAPPAAFPHSPGHDTPLHASSRAPQLDGEPGRGRTLARHYPRGLRIEPHSHTWAQVLYAVAGVMWVETGREAVVVPPQRAVWLPPGTQHAIHMMSAVEMRNLYLHGNDIAHLSTRCEVFEINEFAARTHQDHRRTRARACARSRVCSPVNWEWGSPNGAARCNWRLRCRGLPRASR